MLFDVTIHERDISLREDLSRSFNQETENPGEDKERRLVYDNEDEKEGVGSIH